MADSPQLPSVSLNLDPAGLQLATNLSEIILILLKRAPDEAIEQLWDDALAFADGLDNFAKGMAAGFKRVRRQIVPRKDGGSTQ